MLTTTLRLKAIIGNQGAYSANSVTKILDTLLCWTNNVMINKINKFTIRLHRFENVKTTQACGTYLNFQEENTKRNILYYNNY